MAWLVRELANGSANGGVAAICCWILILILMILMFLFL